MPTVLTAWRIYRMPLGPTGYPRLEGAEWVGGAFTPREWMQISGAEDVAAHLNEHMRGEAVHVVLAWPPTSGGRS